MIDIDIFLHLFKPSEYNYKLFIYVEPYDCIKIHCSTSDISNADLISCDPRLRSVCFQVQILSNKMLKI